MKTYFARLLVCAGLVNAAFAEDWAYFTITTNQAAAVRQKLDSLESGTAWAENDKTEGETCRELIGYYLLYTNAVSVKDKLIISRCLVEFSLFTNASNLAQQYVNVDSNNIAAWEILGACYDYMNSPDKAVSAYNHAVKLGDRESYEPLAAVALKSGNLDVVKRIVPQLMLLKDAKETPKDNKLHLISILTFYSAKTDQKDIFVKTLEGEDLKQMLQNETIRQNIASGCWMFEGKDVDRICQQVEAVKSHDLPTNAVNSTSH